MSIRRAQLKPNDDYEKVFHALSHPTRRQVLILIHAAGGRMSAGEIAARFPHKWPTVTRHLRLLESSRLLSANKSSRERIYTLNKGNLHTTLRGWMNWFQ